MDDLIFDIETAALDDDELALVEPVFDAPSNYRDEAKILAAKAEKRAAWKEKAALSAMTGRVVMIGTLIGDDRGIDMIDTTNRIESERRMLVTFWDRVALALKKGRRIVGWNSNGFDVPFLVQRSWVHEVTHSLPSAWSSRSGGRFVDLMEVFTLGRYGEFMSLDKAAKMLKLGAKNGHGLEVAELLVSNPQKAIDYLANDLLLTQRIANRILQAPVKSAESGGAS